MIIFADSDETGYKLSSHGRRITAKIVDALKDKTEWLTCREIASLIGESTPCTSRWLMNLRKTGIVDFKQLRTPAIKGYWRLNEKYETYLTKK